MDKCGTIRSELNIGMDVEINPKSDRTRQERLEGKIQDILTNTPNHTHGIMVKLSSGEIGRVKKVLSTKTPAIDTLPEIIESANQSIDEFIINGENHFVEFKSSMLWSERLSKEQIAKDSSKYVRLYGSTASKAIIAASMAGFLNADGGDLFIGIKENKNTNKDEIIGIESEFLKLKDKCIDGYRRKILDSIIKPYFPSFVFNQINKYISFSFPVIDNKTICRISILKSNKKVFLNIKNKESFNVRVDASTRTLNGEEVVDYCLDRFN